MESYEDGIRSWQARRVERVAGPDGWTTVVGLSWLDAGSNRVGSDPSSAVRLPSTVPAEVGVLEVEGDGVRFVSAAGADVRHFGKPVDDLAMRDDASGRPTVLTIGSVRFFVIRRYGRLAVRVKDRESPERRAFGGLEYYPIDRRWRVEARFEPHDPVPTHRVPTILDIEEEYLGPGSLAFELEGHELRLEAFLEDPDGDLFVIYGDRTNGTETYGGGRYLYTPQAGPDGIVVLDFNMGYNPPCVFTAHATCPIPLPENRLPIRIEAGEKLFRPTG
jgi:uncharacterized protein (DUF1684 family)